MRYYALLGRQVNFNYELRLRPIKVQALPNRHQLTLVSTHYAARNPHPQVKASLSVTRDELVELHRELSHYLNTHKED